MNIRKIAIAGAGTMGYSMADIFAGKGYEVTLWNRREETLERSKGKISDNSVDKIRYSTNMDDFRGQDLIVESIAENMDLKLDFFRDLSKVTDPETIITTNTSGLSINKLSTSVDNPVRFLGFHWFNPPTLIPLIEIIRTR
ncbi:MAG: 3-hydroxyacyl-CoA dehydrogenase NAD-binding domain-containing protein [Lachnospiraceae bacterium]|jgi:3-hydroxyacyl-CoA dehydrogenase|nr:3-hydroxyacyl-CoA dehydrogenase NAD-binding domain-containing protein [Lachnospiraceae bacterium]MEE3460271.1 3-hydroxyacyl-CoA dehydrogenase NAD-binding domain-containing protein [Lachnospiraceae bacterium]